MRRFFESRAEGWDERTGAFGADHLAPLAAGLLLVEPEPERAIDIGTGTGAGALLVAREFPHARVRGIDLSEEMIRQAQVADRARPGRPRRLQGRATPPPSPTTTSYFDLVTLLNMPPFFAEIARVLRPGGHAVVAASIGPATPFYTPEQRAAARLRAARPGGGRERRGGRRDLLRGPVPRPHSGRLPAMSAERRYVLIVNPSSGAGRGSSLLPEVEQALTRPGPRVPHGRHASLEHGVETATAAHEQGEIPVVMSGDGLDRPDRRRARRLRTRRWASSPAAAATTSPGCSASRATSTEAVDVLAAGNVRQIDVGEVNGERFLCIASMGFDSDANRIANEAKLLRGNLVYAYAALRALAAWKPATFTVALRRRRARRSVTRLRGRRRQQQGVRRRDVHRPRRRARRRPLRRGHDGLASASSASWPTCRRSSRGPTSRRRRSSVQARRRTIEVTPTAASPSTPTAST